MFAVQAQRRGGVAPGGGEPRGRARRGVLGDRGGRCLVGVPARVRGRVDGLDNPVVLGAVGQARVVVRIRGDERGVVLRVRAAGRGRAVDVVAGEIGLGVRVPSERRRLVARRGRQPRRRGRRRAVLRRDRSGGCLVRVPTRVRGRVDGLDDPVVLGAVGQAGVVVRIRGDERGVVLGVRAAGRGRAVHVVAGEIGLGVRVPGQRRRLVTRRGREPRRARPAPWCPRRRSRRRR